MLNVKKILNFLWPYFGVVMGMALMALFEQEFSFVRKDFLDLPFILVSVIASIYGNLSVGVFGIVTGITSVVLLGSEGYSLDFHSLPRVLAFAITSIVILILARRSNNLIVNNLTLSETVSQLTQATKNLKSQVRLNKKDLKHLNNLNKELRILVDDIMDDDKLWASSLKNDVQSKKNSSSK